MKFKSKKPQLWNDVNALNIGLVIIMALFVLSMFLWR